MITNASRNKKQVVVKNDKCIIDLRSTDYKQTHNEIAKFCIQNKFQYISLPVIAIDFLRLSKQDLLPIINADIAIFTSKYAVFSLKDNLSQLGLTFNNIFTQNKKLKNRILAIGPATKTAITKSLDDNQYDLGIEILVPEINSSEGILKFLEQKMQSIEKFVIMKGMAGRDKLENELRSKGIQVETLNLYKRRIIKIEKDSDYVKNLMNILFYFYDNSNNTRNIVKQTFYILVPSVETFEAFIINLQRVLNYKQVAFFLKNKNTIHLFFSHRIKQEVQKIIKNILKYNTLEVYDNLQKNSLVFNQKLTFIKNCEQLLL